MDTPVQQRGGLPADDLCTPYERDPAKVETAPGIVDHDRRAWIALEVSHLPGRVTCWDEEGVPVPEEPHRDDVDRAVVGDGRKGRGQPRVKKLAGKVFAQNVADFSATS
jgi:hypothetical protein